MIKLRMNDNQDIFFIDLLNKIRSGEFKGIVEPEAANVITQRGSIKGMLIDINHFEGWENLRALQEHLDFVKTHHPYIKKVAILGDKTWQKMLPDLVNLFLNPQVKRFEPDEREEALRWLYESVP